MNQSSKRHVKSIFITKQYSGYFYPPAFSLILVLLHTYIFRYEQDPRGNAKEKACILCPEINDVFGLKLHTFEEVFYSDVMRFKLSL